MTQHLLKAAIVLISLGVMPAEAEMIKKEAVDRLGYHYYRGFDDSGRHYQPGYYNNTGYYNFVPTDIGKKHYYHAYERYHQGYYDGGFYGNEYTHRGHFNDGFYNPGRCAPLKANRIRKLIPGGK